MKHTPTELPDVIELVPDRHGDSRGWFSESWNRSTLADLGINLDWVQDNESVSAEPGTIRGIHYQLEPAAQDKLVRVLHGSILDVAVDLRRGSETFGQHVGVTLRADLGNQLLIPKGFGHGFCTLEPDCRIAYKVTGFYDPTCDRSVRFDDPDLGISWPVLTEDASISDKDRLAPAFADADVFE